MKFLRMTENVTPESVTPSSLASLRDAVSVMRELGVVQWGSIVLGPVPVVARAHVDAPKTPEEIEQSERAEYFKTLLHSSGGDPTPFLKDH